MKQHMLQLAQMAEKSERRIIGLMSGTSLDGLDVALCRFAGHGANTSVQLEHFQTLPYNNAIQEKIRAVFARKTIDFLQLTLLNVEVAQLHARMILQCLRDWQVAPETVDLIASHGQTVFHAPRIFHGLPDAPNATLQVGDGDHLARLTGIITLSDFRQKHLAAGGEGAPLALYGDYFLFSKAGEERFLLNIGGIGNFTYLPADGDADKAIATDTGPGNTLLDAWAQKYFNQPCDLDGRLAAAGIPDPWLLHEMLQDPFFGGDFPKTTGPELFSVAWVEDLLRRYPKGQPNPYNVMATLTLLSAQSMAEALKRITTGPGTKKIYTSGGGAHNPEMMRMLKGLLPDFELYPFDVLGVSGDAKEAVLFAVLANETVAGTITPGAILGKVPLVGMGKISLPE
jgi:anhydro-N-acetylmuramic acid kinase